MIKWKKTILDRGICMKAEEVIIDAVIEASRKLPLDAVKSL